MANRYLQGPFAPLQEEYTLTGLEVAGAIPDYLDGRYLRNGPNPIGEIDPEGIEGDTPCSSMTSFAAAPSHAPSAPERRWRSSCFILRHRIRLRTTEC